LVSVTDNEDFALSDRGLLDDNVSTSLNAQENRCAANKSHRNISHVSTPSTSLLIYYSVPPPPAHFTTFPSSQPFNVIQSRALDWLSGLRALKGRRSVG